MRAAHVAIPQEIGVPSACRRRRGARFSVAGPEYAGIYLHARYFDPQLGTFLSPDPMNPTSPGVGPNRYIYGLGDPLNWIDRSGSASCAVTTDGARAGEPHCQEESVAVGPNWGQDKMTSPTQDLGSNRPTQTPGSDRGGRGGGGRSPGGGPDGGSVVTPEDKNGDGNIDSDELHDAIWTQFELEHPMADTTLANYYVPWWGYVAAGASGADWAATILGSPAVKGGGTIAEWIVFAGGVVQNGWLPDHWDVWGRARWRPTDRRRPDRPRLRDGRR